MFQCQVFQAYTSGNTQSYTSKPAIFKVILKLLPFLNFSLIPAKCCYLTCVTFLVLVDVNTFQMLHLIAEKATPYCKSVNTTNNGNSSGKRLTFRNALFGNSTRIYYLFL
jgi:hypothetical protein